MTNDCECMLQEMAQKGVIHNSESPYDIKLMMFQCREMLLQLIKFFFSVPFNSLLGTLNNICVTMHESIYGEKKSYQVVHIAVLEEDDGILRNFTLINVSLSAHMGTSTAAR